MSKPLGQWDVPNSPVTQGVLSPSFLSKVKKGKFHAAEKTIIYGPEGVGKSTLASQCPKPLFLDVEHRTSHIDVDRIELSSYEDVKLTLNELIDTDYLRTSGYLSLVIDTIDWLEVYMKEWICGKNNYESIEDAGYNKGYTYLAEEMFRFLNNLNYFKEQGIHVILVGHSTLSKFEIPDQKGQYDRYTLDLEKKVHPIVKEWADNIFFVNWETKLMNDLGDKKGDQVKKKAVSTQDGWIYTRRTSAYDAKNSHDLGDRLPLRYDSIAPIFSVTAQPPVASTTSAPAPETVTSATGDQVNPTTGEIIEEQLTEKELIERCEAAEKYLAENKVKGFLTDAQLRKSREKIGRAQQVTGMTVMQLTDYRAFLNETIQQIEVTETA